MTRPGISHFILLSLAVHAGTLLFSRMADLVTATPAGPLLITLQRKANEPAGIPTDKATVSPAVGQAVPVTRPQTAITGRTDNRSTPAVVRATETVAAHTFPVTGRDTVSTAPVKLSETPVDTPASLEAELRGQLSRALLPHFHYPLLARRRGWEGTVRVGVRIEADGALTGLHLVESSPHAVLNRAAVESLKRVARLPGAGTWLGGGHFDMVLPVEYRLTDI